MGGRNLTNKLWNAGKFAQMALAGCSDAELHALAAADFSRRDALADLPLVERWVLSSLHQARAFSPAHCATLLAPADTPACMWVHTLLLTSGMQAQPQHLDWRPPACQAVKRACRCANAVRPAEPD